jgi:crossover junction endodeoxyribonuclease RuvC
MTNAIRILGIDPGLRRTGWGVVAHQGARLAHVAHGVIAPPDTEPLAERLLFLFEAISQVIADHAPHEAAVEEVFVNVNPMSTLKLGQARPRARRFARA